MRIKTLEEAVDFTFDELVEELESVRLKLKHLDEARWMLERRVIELMEERGATVADTEGYMVKVTTSVSYDYTILARLREITDPELLKDCYEPAGEKLVKTPEKWNMTKAKKLQALGNEFRDIVDDARISGRPRLSIENKGERRHSDLDTIDHDHDRGLRGLTDSFERRR